MNAKKYLYLTIELIGGIWTITTDPIDEKDLLEQFVRSVRMYGRHPIVCRCLAEDIKDADRER